MSLERYDEVAVTPTGATYFEIGAVAIVSKNQLSIGVAFPERPRFFSSADGFFFHNNLGYVMLAVRTSTEAPWEDLSTGRKFAIEKVGQ